MAIMKNKWTYFRNSFLSSLLLCAVYWALYPYTKSLIGENIYGVDANGETEMFSSHVNSTTMFLVTSDHDGSKPPSTVSITNDAPLNIKPNTTTARVTLRHYPTPSVTLPVSKSGRARVTRRHYTTPSVTLPVSKSGTASATHRPDIALISTQPLSKSGTTSVTRRQNTTPSVTLPVSKSGTARVTRRHYIAPASTLPVSKIGTVSRVKTKLMNEQCLQHLLDNNIVEYYYYPENDERSLNFTVRGITSKKRLKYEHTKPILVVRFVPLDSYNDTFLPSENCSNVRNFMPNMRARDYDLARNLLKFFRHVAALSGMEYYLNYGSLLGYVRFNKRPIPWDDDIDITIDYSTIARFKKIFGRERRRLFGKPKDPAPFQPTLHLGSDRIKVYDAAQNPTHQLSWRFPFLDLFFFSQPEDDFYYMDAKSLESAKIVDAYRSVYFHSFALDDVLPLVKDSFLGVELAVPIKHEWLLSILKYEVDDCSSLRWSHRFERSRQGNRSTVDCEDLEGFYEF